jgi:hypothetical protein
MMAAAVVMASPTAVVLLFAVGLARTGRPFNSDHDECYTDWIWGAFVQTEVVFRVAGD